MQSGNGTEAVKLIREFERRQGIMKEIVIIIVSGHESEQV